MRQHNTEVEPLLGWLRLCGWQVKPKDGHRYYLCLRARDTVYVRFLNPTSSTIECHGKRGVTGTLLTLQVGQGPHDLSSNGAIERLAAIYG